MTTAHQTGGETSGTDDPAAVSWTLLDRDELANAYREHVAPAMREAGMDPASERPSYEWLSANGFRGLVYALREYHGLTFAEFWDADLAPGDEAGYAWDIQDATTIEFLESYLKTRRDRADLSESSVETLRYRLGTYVRAYRAVNDTGAVLDAVDPERDVPAHEAIDAAWGAFDHLDDELAPRTLRRIHGAVEGWYAHLVRRRRAAVNPVSGLEDEYRWRRRETDNRRATNPPLDPAHVRQLYAATTTPTERLFVVAICAWGLRSGEVAALRRDQLVLDDPDTQVPYVALDERKNGPGQVSILHGREAAEERLAQLDETAEYLFPSDQSATGHVTRQTILNWFDDLADRADLPDAIDGQKPVPQMGRRFWYDAYSATRETLVAELGEIAAEQGSASAGVVLQSYLSEERRRTLRRSEMRTRLAAAFEPGQDKE